jgi:hypothetical protein
MKWLPIAEYPHQDWAYGPNVLLTWKEISGDRSYGIGYAYSHEDYDAPEGAPQTHKFMVDEWTVHPDYFAYPTDPENPPNRRHP